MLTLALRRVGTRTMWMRQQGKKTRHPGVYRVNDNSYRVRAVGTDPRTGKKKAVEKLYEGVSAQEAARNRAALIAEIEAATRVATKQRVSDFARSWIASKAVSVDATTASTYADALEQHVLPVLGDYWYDALAKVDVQKWVDDCFGAVWKTPSGKKKRYSRNSVHGWFRVFRTMTRDAVDALHLPTDLRFVSDVKFFQMVAEQGGVGPGAFQKQLEGIQTGQLLGIPKIKEKRHRGRRFDRVARGPVEI